MGNADKWFSKIFVFGLPMIIALAIFDHSYVYPPAPDEMAIKTMIHDLSGLAFSAWMLMTLFLSGRLLVSQEFRDEILGRLTFFRDRDEREIQLSGLATKYTFMSSLAVLGLLLCLSVFQVSIYRVPAEKAVNGKTGTLSLGTNLALLNTEPQKALSENATITYFAHSGLPLTNTALILLFIVWQIGSYNFFMKKRAD